MYQIKQLFNYEKSDFERWGNAMRAIRGPDGEYSLDMGEGQKAELHRSLFRLFVEVSNVRCEWSAQKPDHSKEESHPFWTEHRIIRGVGNMPIKGVTVIQVDGEIQSPLTKLEVELFAIDHNSPALQLGQHEFKKPTDSFLRHWEALPASLETTASPEFLYLAVALQEQVFENSWNELQKGGARKHLRVEGCFGCIDPDWPDQHFIEAGKLVKVEAEQIFVATVIEQAPWPSRTAQ